MTADGFTHAEALAVLVCALATLAAALFLWALEAIAGEPFDGPADDLEALAARHRLQLWREALPDRAEEARQALEIRLAALHAEPAPHIEPAAAPQHRAAA